MSSTTESNKRRAIDALSVSTSATVVPNMPADNTSSAQAPSVAPPIPSSAGNSPRVPRLKPAAPSVTNAWSRPLAAESLRSQSDTSSVKPVKPPVPQRKMTPITETKASSESKLEVKQPIVPLAPKVDTHELERRAQAAGVWRDAIHSSSLRGHESKSASSAPDNHRRSSASPPIKSESSAQTEEEVPAKSNPNQFTDERRNWWELAKRACTEAIVGRLTSSGGTHAMLNRLRASAIRENERLKTLRAGMKPFYGVTETSSRETKPMLIPSPATRQRTRLLIEVRIVNPCASREGYGLIDRRFMTQSDGKRTFGEIRQSLEREFQNIADRYCNTNALAGARPRVELIETILSSDVDFFARAPGGSRKIPNIMLDSAMATTNWLDTDPRAPWQLLEAVVRVTDPGSRTQKEARECDVRIRERAHVIRRRAHAACKEASPSVSPSSSPTRLRKPVFDHDSRSANLFPAANS